MTYSREAGKILVMRTSFLPTMKVKYFPRNGFNSAGEPQYGPARPPIGIAPIKLVTERKHTSIRFDTSGTQSRADVDEFDGRILVHPSHTLRMGDQIEIDAIRYTIAVIEPVRDMAGKLHHNRVDLIL